METAQRSTYSHLFMYTVEVVVWYFLPLGLRDRSSDKRQSSRVTDVLVIMVAAAIQLVPVHDPGLDRQQLKGALLVVSLVVGASMAWCFSAPPLGLTCLVPEQQQVCRTASDLRTS